MVEPILNIPINPDDSIERLSSREWLVTNGLGGYASGTIMGLNTRRYHGLFVPNLSAPLGRTMMLPFLAEDVLFDQQKVALGAIEYKDGHMDSKGKQFLREFRLEWLTPTWIYDFNGHILEKRIFMPFAKNTVYASYRLSGGRGPVRLQLRPYCSCRVHDGSLGYPPDWPFTVKIEKERYEISAFEGAPALRLSIDPFKGFFVAEGDWLKNVFYRLELQRGLDCVENIHSPGFFSFELEDNAEMFFMASNEGWDSLVRDPADIFDEELKRRKNTVAQAQGVVHHHVTSQLALAADQFIALPRTRDEKNARTVMAGYHWFTDWGRDTMISLEGLTLCIGRKAEARKILETFSHYVRNGLLPNHFPEGETHPIYNTADATFWFFHAIDRYVHYTHDRGMVEQLYPILESIIDWHVQGTDFGIYMDPADGLIHAGTEGQQLTWMDAKVDDWVVTPRRGKPVEIQGLWFNALRLMEMWSQWLGKPSDKYAQLAERTFESFHRIFWYKEGGYLYDVVNDHHGNDHSLRPNQIFALSLHFPLLHKDRWKNVVDIVEEKLLTPFGLRTLDAGHKDYHARYEGNRYQRDGAYHQGLVWAWLIGPFLDAWEKVYHDPNKAREFFKAF